MSATRKWAAQALLRAIPRKPNPSVVEWAEEFVKLPGSARSEDFKSSITPWTRAPIECVDDGVTRRLVYRKPVQTGGSVIGEIALCRWTAKNKGGDICSYWPNDEKAFNRWATRIEKILRACPPVAALVPEDRWAMKKGLAIFPHLNLAVRGAFTQKNVESDSFRCVICEEVHDNEKGHGWLPGRLQQAFARSTAFWNPIQLVISNASDKGDQLDQAFEAGTMEYWEVPCPVCGNPNYEANRVYHRMRTRWEDKKPELGGLRYDSDKCKRKDGSYDYNRMQSSIRLQMPCGYEVHDLPMERRELSLGGRYGEPTNTGAHISNRSMTLEAVSVDYIPFLSLIQEKHAALRSLRFGDAEPWRKYQKERECISVNPEDRPLVREIVTSKGLLKNREGLRKDPNYLARFYALDRQAGQITKGEFKYWWLVIRDVCTTGKSELVWEGRCETDEEAIRVLDQHGVVRRFGAADSGYDATHVYAFCLRYGINAIKGGNESCYSHGEEGLKIFSPERPLHQMLNAPQTCEDPIDEPQYWLYSKPGIRDRHAFLRGCGVIEYITPEDVSEDYRKHHESEDLVTKINPDGSRSQVWTQYTDRNDLYVCECYIVMQMDMAGVLAGLAYVPPTTDGTIETP